jgi:hypothetical protein
MTENQLDALIATISEKEMQALSKIAKSENKEYYLYKGQYLAYSEINTMLRDIKNSQKNEN